MSINFIAGWRTEPGEGPALAAAAAIPLIVIVLFFIYGRGYISKKYLNGANTVRSIVIITSVWTVLVILSLILGAIGAAIAFRIGKALY